MLYKRAPMRTCIHHDGLLGHKPAFAHTCALWDAASCCRTDCSSVSALFRAPLLFSALSCRVDESRALCKYRTARGAVLWNQHSCTASAKCHVTKLSTACSMAAGSMSLMYPASTGQQGVLCRGTSPCAEHQTCVT